MKQQWPPQHRRALVLAQRSWHLDRSFASVRLPVTVLTASYAVLQIMMQSFFAHASTLCRLARGVGMKRRRFSIRRQCQAHLRARGNAAAAAIALCHPRNPKPSNSKNLPCPADSDLLTSHVHGRDTHSINLHLCEVSMFGKTRPGRSSSPPCLGPCRVPLAGFEAFRYRRVLEGPKRAKPDSTATTRLPFANVRARSMPRNRSVMVMGGGIQFGRKK